MQKRCTFCYLQNVEKPAREGWLFLLSVALSLKHFDRPGTVLQLPEGNAGNLISREDHFNRVPFDLDAVFILFNDLYRFAKINAQGVDEFLRILADGEAGGGSCLAKACFYHDDQELSCVY